MACEACFTLIRASEPPCTTHPVAPSRSVATTGSRPH
jgi:hypothetical protein